jgi:hypothetical protein
MRLWRIFAVALAASAVVAAAVLVNLAVLGAASSQNDPVGTLSPRAKLPAAPAWTVRPHTAHIEPGDSRDD